MNWVTLSSHEYLCTCMCMSWRWYCLYDRQTDSNWQHLLSRLSIVASDKGMSKACKFRTFSQYQNYLFLWHNKYYYCCCLKSFKFSLFSAFIWINEENIIHCYWYTSSMFVRMIIVCIHYSVIHSFLIDKVCMWGKWWIDIKRQ